MEVWGKDGLGQKRKIDRHGNTSEITKKREPEKGTRRGNQTG